MDFLTDSRDQFFKNYLHIFFNGLKSFISFIYFTNKSTKERYVDSSPAPRPLVNIGLNCYLNSAFQSIVACPRFVQEMKKLENIYPTANNLFVFNKILSALSNNSQEALKITSNGIFKNWNKDGEQDTFELLSHILFQIFNELKVINKKQTSDKVVYTIIEEKLLPLNISMIFKIRCSLGHNSIPNFQTDLALHLPIPFRITTEELTMEKLIDNYFIEEDISDCKCLDPTCQAQVSKFVTLKRPLPSTLCIHLQRSFWNSYIGKMQKNNAKVKFNEKLIIKENYFNPSRNTKCVEGLLFRTFHSILDKTNLSEKTYYFNESEINDNEANYIRNVNINTIDGGDVASNKKSYLTLEEPKNLKNLQSSENTLEGNEADLHLDVDVTIKTQNYITLSNCEKEEVADENYIPNSIKEKMQDRVLSNEQNERPTSHLRKEIFDCDNDIYNSDKDSTIIKCEDIFDKKSQQDRIDFFRENNEKNLNFDNEKEEYLLKSVITHFGNPESGHYICHRKCGRKWFCTNDSFIREVSIQEVLNSEAYILMYEKDF